MPEVTTLSILQALPFEKVDRAPYKKLIMDNWDRKFKIDDQLEMEQIIWTAYAKIDKAGYEISDAPLDILKETAEKLRMYLWRYFDMNEMYPISQETLDMVYGKPKKKHWWQR